MQLITDWFRRNFSNPQVVILGLFLIGLFAVLIFLGGMLVPVLVAVVIAICWKGWSVYWLDGVCRALWRFYWCFWDLSFLSP